jgi:hypothetical protein
MDLIYRNHQNPLIVRAVEGLSTNMLLGFWYGGGCVDSSLSYAYILHWMASFYYHTCPSFQSFMIDTHFIDMVVMERLYYLHNSIMIYIIYLFFMLSNSNRLHPFICFGKNGVAVALSFVYGKFPYEEFLFFLMAGGLYILSDICLQNNRLYLKCMAHTCFHFCMTICSYLETNSYCFEKNNNSLWIVVYFLYILRAVGILLSP